MINDLKRVRHFEKIRKESMWLGYWNRFGQIMAVYYFFLLPMLVFGDLPSSAAFSVVIATLIWGVVGALVSFSGASKESQRALAWAAERERELREDLLNEITQSSLSRAG